MSANTWNIDTVHSAISFSVRHMVISKVRGRFARWSGAVQIDEGDLTRSTVEVTIEAASLDTGVADRDTHLRSPDFFDVERFPQLRYHGRRLEKLGEDRYRLIGDLTLRQVTREVSLEVELGGRALDPWGKERIGFVARGHLDRKDFGLRWNQALEAGGVVVGDRIDLEIELEVVSAAAAAAAA